MAAISDLNQLLQQLSPKLDESRWVYCLRTDNKLPACKPLATIKEKEGLTLIIDPHEADRLGLKYDHIYALITLQVHSDLNAVGLTAAVSQKLAEASIPANMLAGYFHDHILVPEILADKALRILSTLPSRII